MPKINPLGLVGVISLCASLFIPGVHLLAGDVLLFLSDPFSLAIWVGAMTLAVTPALMALALVILFIPERYRHLFVGACSLILAAVIIATFLTLAILVMSELLEIEIPRFGRRRLVSIIVLFLIGLLLAATYIWLYEDRHLVIARVQQLGLILLAAAMVVVPANIGFHHLLRADISHGSGRHLVLLVFDGMPSQFIHTYNPAARRTSIDDLLADSLVFDRMRTSVTYTHGYFGVLYSGITEVVGGGPYVKELGQGLLAQLDLAGIGVRWISYHRNGIPESSASQLSNYPGLRSYLLTQKYAWLPELLGLNYHIALSSPSISKNLTENVGKPIFRVLNGERDPDYSDVLTGLVLPQLRAIRSRSESTFTIFHIGYDRLVPPTVPTVPRAQAGVDDFDDIIARIRREDSRYAPELESLAEKFRERAAAVITRAGDKLAAFVATLKQDEYLRDTTVIMTADHGSMYSDGRLWYGFHPTEQVIRVPFAILNGTRSGMNSRLLATPDITRSILEFFDVTVDGDSRALSIFRDHGHDHVASLTRRSSDLNREWFLVLQTDDVKYKSNLHPSGRGETKVLAVKGYREAELDETIGPPPQSGDIIPLAIRRFGINPANIHHAFR